MHKLQLAYLVTTAVLSIFLQCRVEAEDPIDMFNQFLPAEYRNFNSLMGEVKQNYSYKCKKAAEGVENSTIYQDFEKGVTELTACFTGMTNVTKIGEEIKKTRDLDTVFNKHCTDAIKCLRDFNEKVQPCRSASEREQNAVTMRVVTGLLDFMCSMNTSHVMRVFEEGLKCLEATHAGIDACFRYYFRNALPKDIRDLLSEPGHCREWEDVHRCTIRELERCQGNTPASVAEYIFEIIKNGPSCTKKEPVDMGIKLLDSPWDTTEEPVDVETKLLDSPWPTTEWP